MNGTRSTCSQLALVNFLADDLVCPVRKMLTDLGHRVYDCPGSELLTHIAAGNIDAVVIVIGRGPRGAKQAETLLARPMHTPTMVIFTGQQTECWSQIMGSCTEFSVWPFGQTELKLRVQQLWRKPVPAIEHRKLAGMAGRTARMALIGESQSFLSAMRATRRFAEICAPVLISGETGTGKDLAARAIHYQSDRANLPFVPVNCGALPDALIENELFGHEAGAYTGAQRSQPGLVVQANGGTLFLDEIDTLSAHGQTALLHFLEKDEFRPLGGKNSTACDVRVIAATNAELPSLIEARRFRADLYFRLNILHVCLPPLRTRYGDIDRLTRHFLEQLRIRYNEPDKRLSSRALDWLETQSWPGNVRELENYLHRRFVLCQKTEIDFGGSAEETPADSIFPNADVLFRSRFNVAKAKIIESFEREYLVTTMARSHGNVSHAARLAGKERRSFGRLLKKHSVKKEEFVT